MNQLVGLFESPLGLRPVPHPVEPNAADRAVIGQQLFQLPVHIINVFEPLAALGPAGGRSGSPAREIVGMMPIELRIIKEEIDSLLMAFVGEHIQIVFLVWSWVSVVPVTLL